MQENALIKGANIVLEKLIEQGVTTVFGYPGGAVIPIYHELVHYRDRLKHYRASHEQHAVHAADGYARSTGKVGVCLVTSGPGATNTVTGIATAFMDSIPMVILSGQVPSHLIGKDAFQEVDITSMTLAITKHNFIVRQFEDLGPIIDKAFHIARSGRPGPVLIDIPKDFLTKTIERNAVKNNPDQDENPNKSLSDEVLVQIATWIKSSSRPLIYCGGGVKISGADALILKLAEKIDAPVINTLMGLGTIDRRHELSLGMAGMHGSKTANEAINQCDLMLAIGVRFSDRVVGKPTEFATQAKIIHIDLDPTEHEKNLKVDLILVGDVKESLTQMLPHIEEKKCDAWKTALKAIETAYPSRSNIDWVFEAINKQDDGQTIYATDVGQHQMWSAQKLAVSESHHFLSSGGLGTMGYGLGAAFGAKIGNPDKRVTLITGDGSFRMNMQELATLMDYKCKVDILLFDNRALGMVKQWQTLFQDQVYSETQISGSLDYRSLANAFGMCAFHAKDKESLETALTLAKNELCSTLTIIRIPTDENVFPIVPPGSGLNQALYK